MLDLSIILFLIFATRLIFKTLDNLTAEVLQILNFQLHKADAHVMHSIYLFRFTTDPMDFLFNLYQFARVYKT